MTTYYIDYNRGDDASADPTKQATPWKELTKIGTITTATAGDQFLLADDSSWQYEIGTNVLSGINWTGTKDNPVVIGRYSPSGITTSAKPTIQFGNYIDSGDWTYSAPNNGWTWTAPSTLHIGLLLLLGDELSGVSNVLDGGATLATRDGAFYVSGTTLYLYAPAGTDPTTYYGSVFASAGTTGLFQCGPLARAITFQDLNFTRCGHAIYIYTNSTTPLYIRMNRITANKVSELVRAVSASSNYIHIHADRWELTEWGSCVFFLFASPSSSRPIARFELSNSTFTDGNYGQMAGVIYSQAWITSCDIHHNKISGARFGNAANPYDGCCLYQDVGGSGFVARSNHFVNSYIGIQDGGGILGTYYNNLFECKLAILISDADAYALNNIVFTHNTVIGGHGGLASAGSIAGAGIYTYRNSGDAVVSHVFTNNIFVNLGESDATTQSAILQSPIEPPAYSDYSNNLIYGFDDVVTEWPGTTPLSSPNSVDADPLLTDDYRLTAASPALRAGKHVQYGCDFYGVSRWNPPSIGAFEYQPARTTRDLPTA